MQGDQRHLASKISYSASLKPVKIRITEIFQKDGFLASERFDLKLYPELSLRWKETGKTHCDQEAKSHGFLIIQPPELWRAPCRIQTANPLLPEPPH